MTHGKVQRLPQFSDHVADWAHHPHKQWSDGLQNPMGGTGDDADANMGVSIRVDGVRRTLFVQARKRMRNKSHCKRAGEATPQERIIEVGLQCERPVGSISMLREFLGTAQRVRK